MNLKYLEDQNLRNILTQRYSTEREYLVVTLYHMLEVERRRVYCDWGFTSMFDYATKELKCSEAQAVRRIAAMRLLKELPEIEGKIATGQLSLTNLAMAKTHFARTKMDARQKKEFLKQLENKSTRQAQKLVNPQMKALDYNMIRSESLREKLLLLKGRLAHSHPNISLEDLLQILADGALEEKTPSAPKVDSKAEVSRQVWRRDQHKCTNCSSTYAVEKDHITPKAAGGQDTYTNQRLLCRNCNQRAAIIFYGGKKMQDHLQPRTHNPASAPWP